MRKHLMPLLFFICKHILGVSQIQISQPITIDIEKELNLKMKKLQFTETVQKGWIRGFTNVLISKDNVLIGHDIKAKGNKMTFVSNPLLTIEDWIKYFDRL